MKAYRIPKKGEKNGYNEVFNNCLERKKISVCVKEMEEIGRMKEATSVNEGAVIL